LSRTGMSILGLSLSNWQKLGCENVNLSFTSLQE
jgi:hypothetical protein